MKTCYVTTPFGRKENPQTGHVIDYDRIYLDVLKPAIEAAACQPLRADEGALGGIMQKGILRLAIASDIFIADVGAGNPNVLYELGVRHATQRGVTLLIAEGGSRVAFNINYSRVFMYRVGGNGLVDSEEALRFQRELTRVIQLSVAQTTCDSPIFEFFPGYRLELPIELMSAERAPKVYPLVVKEAVGGGGNAPGAKRGSRAATRKAEDAITGSQEADPAAMIDLLKRYRDLSAWDDLIRFSDTLPTEVGTSGQVRQLVALALNRRDEPGDRDRAIRMMEDLIAASGGDGETHGILGRIYKDLFDEGRDPANLKQAIDHYRAGFEKDPSDYYPGLNLVNLLAIYGGEGAKSELEQRLPEVRRALAARMDPSRSNYWELATALHLAAMARQWDEARSHAERIQMLAPERWMLQTTRAELERLLENMSPSDAQSLHALLALLKPESRDA